MADTKRGRAFGNTLAMPAPTRLSDEISEDQAAANRRGILAITGAMAIYTVSDVLVKLTSDFTSTPQMMVVRGLAAAAVTFFMVIAAGQWRRLPFAFTPLIAVRGLLDAGATWSFLMALRDIPLADATTILLAAPLLMMPMALFILRERVGWRRWCATLVGFVGVVLVMQPQGDWHPSSLYALGCTGFVAVREIMTRRLPASAPTLGVTLISALAISGVGILGTVGSGWQPIDTGPFWILIGAGLLNAGGNYLNATGFRIGQSSAVAPFRYTTIPLSFAAGILVWGTYPTLLMTVGALLILGGGLIVMRGERSS